MRRENLLNQRFGKLVVVSLNEQLTKEKGYVYWNCQCDCGQMITTRAMYLKRGSTKSCGCLAKEHIRKVQKETVQKRKENLTGQKFGKLTVLSSVHKEMKGSFWLCQCDCGETTVVRADHLKAGATLSCGCLKSLGEQYVNTILKNNCVDFKKEYCFSDLKGNNGLLRFDFVLFKQNRPYIAIECQGKQHYQPIEYFGGQQYFEQLQKYDALKRQYCNERKIQLITIPYYDYNKIDFNYLKEKGVFN